MGRSKRKRRDSKSISNQRLPLFIGTPTIRPTPQYTFRWAPVEDNRSFHPDGAHRSVRDIYGSPVSYQVFSPSPRRSQSRLSNPYLNYLRQQRQVPWQIQFVGSKKVLTCVRRQERKEVLHALRKTGRGRGSQRRPRWTSKSYVRCR